ncbi:hypothetical protein E2562_015833 [Oryza meyeriana var. granulata]|uniref:Uncharacterized protein n=1 Tax=Oryza meyeriana var. granulata TaxID=110450 RepID=A0A6G1D6D7_9ORYZ|nr:hypothetical protein E2562_015833 [Oryza meyeriana var. granulata]
MARAFFVGAAGDDVEKVRLVREYAEGRGFDGEGARCRADGAAGAQRQLRGRVTWGSFFGGTTQRGSTSTARAHVERIR